jgi:hypothetical protein
LIEKFNVRNFDSLENENFIEILENLQPVKAEYPSILMAKQRSAFLAQAENQRRGGWAAFLHAAIQKILNFTPRVPEGTMMNAFRRALIVAGVIAVAYAGILIYGNRDQAAQPVKPEPTLAELAQPVLMSPTATDEILQTTCSPESTSSICSTYGFDKNSDEATWISKSADSWIRIDTGRTAIINMVEFDKKRLDSPTGEFIVSVALSENKYKPVFDSKFDDSAETDPDSGIVRISFGPELARYVMITVSEPGTEINEVRAFAMKPPASPVPSQVSRNTKEPPVPTIKSSNTPLPTRTKTATPTSTPTPSSTSTATSTTTPLPSSTPTATYTGTPFPSSTPTATYTSTPLPTNTRVPTNTPLPTSTRLPTSTPLPTNTSPPTLMP